MEAQDRARSDRRTRGAGVRHGRVPWLAPDDLDETQRAVRDSIVGGPRSTEQAFSLTDADGRLEGPFNLMLVAPGLGLALSELGAALRYRTSLTPRSREIAILTVGLLQRSPFEWYAHEAVARRIGMTDEELVAIAELRPAGTFDETERMVQLAVRTMVGEGDLDDATYARLEAVLGVEGTVELVVLTGHYATLALAMRVLRTPLPDGVADPLPSD
jgi:4-carboxymuconolactone decarboxylase